MKTRIKGYIYDTMKNYGVSGGKTAKELYSACCDEYDMQISNGAAQEQAYSAAVANVEEIVKGMVRPANKFTFSLSMGVLALIISIGEMFASLLDDVYFYNVEMPIVLAGWVIIAILYAIFARRSLRWYNFVILGALLISWLASFFSLFVYFFFNGPPGCWQRFYFIFPCVFERHMHRDWFADGEFWTNYIFYSNFLVSLAVFVATLVMFINEKIKKSAKL